MRGVSPPALDPLAQPAPPSVDEMLSWTALTPHFEEDVVYALNSASVAKQFSLDPTAARVSKSVGKTNECMRPAASWSSLAPESRRVGQRRGGL